MARLPDNVDRIQDGRGYRYVAYAADGSASRLTGGPGLGWNARVVRTGEFAGSGRTIADVAAKVAAFNPQGSK